MKTCIQSRLDEIWPLKILSKRRGWLKHKDKKMIIRGASAKPVIAPEGSYIPEPPEALEQLAFLWSAPEALEQLTFLRSPLEG